MFFLALKIYVLNYRTYVLNFRTRANASNFLPFNI